MARHISDDMLEAYVAGHLAGRDRRRVDAALRTSPELRSRLEAFRREHETLEAIRDSFEIRLPEKEEERIVTRSLGRLDTTLGTTER